MLRRESEEAESHNEELEDEGSEESTEIYDEDVYIRNLKSRVLSVLLGNLFTMLLVSMVYFNYVLFESYLGVFLYAFLASEALWDSKCDIVEFLDKVNNKQTVSPAQFVERWTRRIVLSHYIIFSTVCILLSVYAIVYAWEKYLVSLVVVGVTVFLGATLYVVDRHVFIILRVHRILMTDDTLVALGLIVFILIFGISLAAIFMAFTFSDIRELLLILSHTVENRIMENSFSKELWDKITKQSSEFLEEYLRNFENLYVANTTWEPMFRVGLQYLDDHSWSNSTNLNPSCSLDKILMSQCTADESTSATSIWDRIVIPDYEAFMQTFDMLRQEANLQHKVKDALLRVSDSAIYIAFLLISSIFVVVDFGIRVWFFFTILFLLLSSRDNLMHEVLTGFFSSDDDIGTEGTSEVSIQRSYVLNLELQLRSTMEAVFSLPVKMALCHAAITLLLFKIMGLRLLFLAASMTMVLTIFPFILPYFVCLPWTFTHIASSNYGMGFGLFFLHWLCYTTVDSWLLSTFRRKVRASEGAQGLDQSKNEYVTGISIFFGVTAFGIHGIIVGPLLVCLGIVTYNTLRDQQRDVQFGVGETVYNQRRFASGTPSRRSSPAKEMATAPKRKDIPLEMHLAPITQSPKDDRVRSASCEFPQEKRLMSTSFFDNMVRKAAGIEPKHGLSFRTKSLTGLRTAKSGGNRSSVNSNGSAKSWTEEKKVIDKIT